MESTLTSKGGMKMVFSTGKMRGFSILDAATNKLAIG